MAHFRLGRIDESFYAVVGGVVAGILRRHGHDVSVVDGSHTAVYGALGAGTVDLAVAFWLPTGHAEPWRRVGDVACELATLYEGARFFWAVPTYADARLQSIADLANAELGEGVPRAIRGLSLDATITTASKTAVAEYGLAAAGFRLEPGDFAAWEASLKEAVAARKPVVLPLWTPYYLNVVFDLRALEDPRRLLGGANRVVLAARRGIEPKIGEAALADLRSSGLDLEIVSELDRQIHREGHTPDDVAARWLDAR